MKVESINIYESNYYKNTMGSNVFDFFPCVYNTFMSVSYIFLTHVTLLVFEIKMCS